MPIDETPRPPSGAPAGNVIANDASIDDIVSVNTRGRRSGGRAAPFVVIGGIALVVLIGLLLTVNVVSSKMAGPKPAQPTSGAAQSGLARTFASDSADAPALPGGGEAAASSSAAAACPDGSAGNELRGQDGVVVRNASGQGVRVCSNGQVIGVTPAGAASAAPIPVEPRVARNFGNGFPRSGGTEPRPADRAMMINDGKAGAGQIVPDLANPQALLAAAQQATTAVQPKTEGLLAGPPVGSLEAELSPSKTPMVQAAKLNDLNFLLPKGKTIDCGMSMKIVSSLAGLASCVLTSNIYSANGKVVLLERGSEAVGEYRSGVSVGQRRLFVLWDRIITPSGVVINLESPGADELGSTGLTGRVDNHWFERIGSAFLLSTVQDAIQYEVAAEQAKSAGGVALVFGNTAQTGNSMADKVLDATINIPATIYKDQGDRAVIYVARDLDFSNVYRLAARP